MSKVYHHSAALKMPRTLAGARVRFDFSNSNFTTEAVGSAMSAWRATTRTMYHATSARRVSKAQHDPSAWPSSEVRGTVRALTGTRQPAGTFPETGQATLGFFSNTRKPTKIPK